MANIEQSVAFKLLVEQPAVLEFLEKDRCFQIVDSYLLSMAYVYMTRAGYSAAQFTTFNLIVAIYLAHEMEEDDIDIKSTLLEIATGGSSPNKNFLAFFGSRKTKLWKDLKFRTVVSREECEYVMCTVLPGHYIWRRIRAASHAYCPIRFYIKEYVYFSRRYHTNLNAFRCLTCEGICCLAERSRRQREAIYGTSKFGQPGKFVYHHQPYVTSRTLIVHN